VWEFISPDNNVYVSPTKHPCCERCGRSINPMTETQVIKDCEQVLCIEHGEEEINFREDALEREVTRLEGKVRKLERKT